MDEADKENQKSVMSSSTGPVNGNASFIEGESNFTNTEERGVGFSENGGVTSGKENSKFYSDEEKGNSDEDVTAMSLAEERKEDSGDENEVTLEDGTKALSLKEKNSEKTERLIERRCLVVEHNHGDDLSGLAQTIRLALNYGKVLMVRKSDTGFKKYFVKFVDAASALKMVEDISFLLRKHDLQVSYFMGYIQNGILQANKYDSSYCFTEYIDFHDKFVEDKYKSKSGIFCESFIDLDILWRGYWEVKSSFSHVTPADFLDGLLLIDLPPTQSVCEHIVTFLKLRCYEKLCPKLQCTELSSNILQFVNQLNAGAVKAEERTIKVKPGYTPGNLKNGLKTGNSLEIRGSKSLLCPQLLSLALQHGNVVKMRKIEEPNRLLIRVLFDEPSLHKKMVLVFKDESLQEEKEQLEIDVQTLRWSAVNCNPHQHTAVSFDNLNVFNNMYLASEYVAFWNELQTMGVNDWDDDADEVVHSYFLLYIQLKFFFFNITSGQFLKHLSITKEAFTKGTREPLRLQFQLYENIALNLVEEEGVQKLNHEAIETLNDPHFILESLEPIKFVTHEPTVLVNRGETEKYNSLVGKLRKIYLSGKEPEQKKDGLNSENSEAKTDNKKKEKTNKSGVVQTGTGPKNSQKSEKAEAKKAPKKKKKETKRVVQTGAGRGNSRYKFKDLRGAQFQRVAGRDAHLDLHSFQKHFDLRDSRNVYGRLGPQIVPEMNSQLGGWGQETWDPIVGNSGFTGPPDMQNYMDSLKNTVDRYFVGSGTGTNKSAIKKGNK